MNRLTQKEKMFNGDVVLDFNNGDNVLDLAKEKLWQYENTELSPSEVAALKAENAELKEHLKELKKALDITVKFIKTDGGFEC